jgi:RNA polymerase sigma-70 factor (ECF subfamily)
VNNTHNVDEKRAIARLKKGDISGLETLVYKYQLQAIRTVGLITGDGAMAEDIVQSAFIRVAERISQFDDRRLFWPWFLRSVIHDAIKAANRQKRLVSLDADENEESIDLVDPMPCPEEIIERAETTRAVQSALERIPPNQRAVVVMRYYLGMSEAEIAEALHGPIGTVKWWLHAARQRLLRMLSPLRQNKNQPTDIRSSFTKSDLESGDQK